MTFTAKYEGRSTMVSALVLSSIQDEVLLSWKALVDLGVITDSFPHVEARAAGAKASNQMTLEVLLAHINMMRIRQIHHKRRRHKTRPKIHQSHQGLPSTYQSDGPKKIHGFVTRSQANNSTMEGLSEKGKGFHLGSNA